MNERTLCKHCLIPNAFHGGAKNPHRPFACPAQQVPPKWPASYEKNHGEAAAGVLFDKLLAKYWMTRITTFEPVT